MKITIMVLILLGCTSGYAGGKTKVLGVDTNLIESAVKGKELIFRRRYSEAMALFKGLEVQYPDSPTGLAGQMAVWQVKMFEHDDFRYRPQFSAAEKRYVKFSRQDLRKGDVPSWDLFVYGAADGMRGFFRTREEKWLKALSSALHAIRMLKQLKFKEPDFIDVDLGLGSYIYWRSVVTKEIKILPFFSDRRKEGIAMVERAAAEGKYAADLALANLMYIYGDNKNYDKSFQTADRLLLMYPENLIIRFLKGRFSIWAKKYDQAYALFEYVYNTDPTIYNALLYQGIILYKKKEIVKARSKLQKYLGLASEKYGRSLAYFWLGLIAESEKDNSEAIRCYEEALKLNKKLKAAKKRIAKLEKAAAD